MRGRRPGRDRERAHRPFAHAILDGVPLVAVDVGAARGIPDHWRPFETVAHFVAFEPHPPAFRELAARFAAAECPERWTVLPVALSGRGGRRELHVPATATGASLLRLHLEGDAADYLDTRDVHPYRSETVETRRLDDVFDERGESGPHLVKLDAQGAEQEILEGCGDRLAHTTLIETEANLLEVYRGQPTFTELSGFLAERGFEVLDLRPERAHLAREGRRGGYHREVFGVYSNCPRISARVWHVDAVYVRAKRALVEAGDAAAIRRHIVALCGYGFFAEAFHLAELTGDAGVLHREASERLRAGVQGWFRAAHGLRRYARGRLMRRLRRAVGPALIPEDRRRWAQYLWRSYPHG